MLKFFAILLTLAFSNSAFAQTDEVLFPRTMLEFLKPGMHIGLQSFDGTTSVIVSTYTDAHFALAQQIAKWGSTPRDAEEFASANEIVRKELDKYISNLDSPDVSAEKISVMPLIRTSLGTLVAVGEDFILVELDGDSKQKRIVPKASIGTINLDVNPVRFLGAGRRFQPSVRR